MIAGRQAYKIIRGLKAGARESEGVRDLAVHCQGLGDVETGRGEGAVWSVASRRDSRAALQPAL
jgi:hypothetical protein